MLFAFAVSDRGRMCTASWTADAPSLTTFWYCALMTDAVFEPLTIEQVRHVAKLSRLRLSDSQLEQYRVQMTAVLLHVSKLNELDVTGVVPLAHPTEITNRIEADEVGPTMPIEALLRNAPGVEDCYIAVPKVLTDEG
jgi:aspartyl-tRNA(Asn)/glutamyl-tRNA(Gln) amidotransferase subunit C